LFSTPQANARAAAILWNELDPTPPERFRDFLDSGI
jgi:hypothetical protein